MASIEELFNEDLHGGEEINDMIHYNEYYIKCDNENRPSEILFPANGNLYKIQNGKPVECIPGDDPRFIEKHIEKAINNFVETTALKGNFGKASYYDDIIECRQDNSCLRILIDRHTKIVRISNILIPNTLVHQGLGKQLINEIYKVATKDDYKLHLVDMVQGFYKRMLKRGAKVIESEDILEITDQTRLID
ncbi:hypothetical protein DWW69_09715 [Bacteroides sp. AF16-49]|uniref:hypothetical protein n=1 Tax=Bacteroides sp. AF16-49 TaxID=2292192 RepID=UPI000EFE2B30|nr:hypothetical protein [Bacteroides sp. AF16-49]RHR75556.1 hypothetical protein DWW69_09715 [Bacteroides sp. AF16-49]